ncbi:MAG: HEAT repeat domain-containing protein, partial [Planctomycetota bacterium]
MARSFSQVLIAAAVAAAVSGTALAQGSLQEAVTKLRLGKKDEAVEELRKILQADPSSADALQLYRSVSQDEWFLMITHRENGDASEIQKIAQSILERAKVESKQRSRDEAAIAALVATATDKASDYGTRQAAVNKLIAEHGEFAVPALVGKLGNPDDADGQILAILALQDLRSAAVLPLVEALKSSNALVVQNAAAALSHIGDSRATPAMAALANDDRAPVRDIASKFLGKQKAAGNAVDLLLAQSAEYLAGIVPVGGYSEVVWSLRDDKLVATDVPALLYPTELAKACAADAVRLSPSSLPARSALAQANLAQANMIEAAIAQGDEASKPLEPVAAELKIAALATGVDAVRAALDAGVSRGLAPVARGAIDALSQIESADSVAQSSLLAALQQSTDKGVRYAAAEALVRASGGVRVPQNDAVVAVLAEAVTEESVRTIQVIAPALDTRAAVEATGKQRGFAVDASADALSGMRSLLVNPNVDVVVINEILPDRQPEDVIVNIKKDSRMANTRIVIVAKDEAAAKARFGDSVGVIVAPLTPANLVEAVNKALEGATTPGNARAEAYAAKASSALLAIAANKGAIASAVANLVSQLNRGDAVAVPAAKALGHGAGAEALPGLVGALGGGGSVDLKKAAADACGSILALLGTPVPDA